MSIRVGFIGTGGIAGVHLRNLTENPKVKLVAFCDIVEEKAQNIANQYGGTAYTDHQKMFNKEEMDAVYVCLPPFAHSGQELMAVEKGCALFIEKPIALSMEKACQISEAIAKKGVVSSVGYNWRYLATTDIMLEKVNEKKPSFAQGYWVGGMPGVHWWRVKAESGGQIVEQTTHVYDLARYVLGDVKLVNAIAVRGHMTDVPDYDVDDASLVNLTFESGVIANIASSCIQGQWGRVNLIVCGRDFSMENDSARLTIKEPGRTEIIENKRNPYVEEDKIFIDAVESKDASKIRSPYADAVKSLQVTLAANQSIAEGKTIAL